ncbi:Cold shock domain-containing protein E1 [Orchesella cincta]|uniref:Cold shock domain-containing protein E1 n=1 Tax=Orchesella cincta TaxID=48709 RepID=A0A1D2MDP0_ORCCI|nr:Cold shock domain-containing protein E1 [Orchesella cincta]
MPLGRSNNDNNSSSVFGSDDMSQSNGHGNHYGNGSNSNSNSNYQHQNSRDRDRDNQSSSNTFQSGGSSGSGNNQSSTTNRTNEHGDNSFNQGVRETGIIEKLLHSYGFIQCCERQARLFFHFSQFEGTIEHLKLGDPVEFEMTYDRRTGKPIASAVTKIGPEVSACNFFFASVSERLSDTEKSRLDFELKTAFICMHVAINRRRTKTL